MSTSPDAARNFSRSRAGSLQSWKKGIHTGLGSADRFAKALAQLYQGFVAIGMRDDVAWATVARVALDCMPTLRRRCIVALVQTPGASTSSITERTAHPSWSTRRALEELVTHGLADRDGETVRAARLDADNASHSRVRRHVRGSDRGVMTPHASS